MSPKYEGGYHENLSKVSINSNFKKGVSVKGKNTSNKMYEEEPLTDIIIISYLFLKVKYYF